MDISNMRFPSPLTVTELNQYIKDLIDEIGRAHV